MDDDGISWETVASGVGKTFFRTTREMHQVPPTTKVFLIKEQVGVTAESCPILVPWASLHFS